jgi:tetratricopeptide (TPR) repeat protein
MGLEKQFDVSFLRKEMFTTATVPVSVYKAILSEEAQDAEEQRREEALAREEAAHARQGEALLTRLLEGIAKPTPNIKYTDRLLDLLRRLAADYELTEDELKELAGAQGPSIVAMYYERQCRITGDRWKLTKASRYWRAAHYAQRAVDITAPQPGDSPGLQATLLTTRGAAYRDLGRYADAERCISEAGRRNPNSDYVRNLWRGVHSDRVQFGEEDSE